MAKKDVTIDDLAMMVQKGFTGIDKQFDEVKENIRVIKNDLTIIKGQVGNKIDQHDFDKLESRVEYLEKVK